MRLSLAAAMSAGPSLAAPPYSPPRTASGAPDLQGLWTNASQTRLERGPVFRGLVATPEEVAGFEEYRRAASAEANAPVRPDAPAPPPGDDVGDSEWREWGDRLGRVRGEPRTSWIIDPPSGRLPLSGAGVQAQRAAAQMENTEFSGPEGRPVDERCLMGIGAPAGPPMLNATYNANYQILQTPNEVVILVEMNHDVRIIRLSQPRAAPGSVKRWMGESIGSWDGDTLVAETTNLDPRQSGQFNFGGRLVLSEKARIVERFTRTGPTEIVYRFTVSDPLYYTRDWTAETALRATRGPIYEYACHEGNYALRNTLAGARRVERDTQAIGARRPR